MENQPSNLRESLWRRKPTEAELRGQPELESEARLTDLLAKTPEVPVSSNFTARVLAAIDLAEKQAARPAIAGWNWRVFFARIAVAAVAIMVAGVAFHAHEKNLQRRQIAKSLAMVARADSLPSVDALENLEAIQRMSQSSHADGELLAVMQ